MHKILPVCRIQCILIRKNSYTAYIRGWIYHAVLTTQDIMEIEVNNLKIRVNRVLFLCESAHECKVSIELA